ncbi:hypothetical protein Aph01nite_39690 [Acrocarpospora phusangensis]|uniref:DUF1449 domain-containing protein n=1 Tax=Acrocarpospora phusangensis TaxID=1070424 RepID=A0A919QDE4_9ACTN|nr:hypothetical protein [Acrocarpospora phusangensis]GIH25659.1 hypothetical protein Aph01nite_39690 [Acrocarpospora phusangensis]
MSDLVETALEFPAVLFTFALLVVLVFWVLVVTGLADLDDGELLSIPMAAAVSFFVAVAWFVTLAGTHLFTGGPARVAVLAVALAGGWLSARLLLSAVRKALPAVRAPSRTDFVGRLCVLRTSTVTRDFGQAEVHAEDGSSAVIQVRQTGTDTFRAGGTALIFDYDAEGEFFWVMPYEGEL